MTLADTLADLSTAEIVSALGVGPRRRRFVSIVARIPSARLGRSLARFDARVGEAGIARAAAETLERFGARIEVEGSLSPDASAALVVTNHPGAYDALATMAALGRDDLSFVAADRAFLRALPNVREHLVFADEGSARVRAAAVRRALSLLRSGGVVVQYGAGEIEPDARFDEGSCLAEWSDGTGLLAARASAMGARVIPVFVSGVHSARAKRLPFVRWAERRGTTTIAPLVQATLPGFRDVVVRVRIGAPIERAVLEAAPSHAARAALVREAVAALGLDRDRDRKRSLGTSPGEISAR